MEKAARILAENKEQIINDWIVRVRRELSAPKYIKDPVLRDHMPHLMDDIVFVMRQSINTNVEFQNFKRMLDHNMSHGRDRSFAKGYDMEQVLKEYLILHKILTNYLRSEGRLPPEVYDLLKYLIEECMVYAAVAFQKSLLEMRQKMMGVLIHDVRNPIAAAHIASGILDQKMESEEFSRIRRLLSNSIRRTLKLLESFLEAVTVGAGEGITLNFSKQDLYPYLKSVQEEASAIYPNKIILNALKEPMNGIFDNTMIRRVLENIISNAVKYGGKDSPITIDVVDAPDLVEIAIHNRGNPIPKEKQKKIFDYKQTSRGKGPLSLKSWGLGLTMVNAVAEAHGGHLKLESTQESGTTFTLVVRKNANSPGKVKTRISFDYDNNHLNSI